MDSTASGSIGPGRPIRVTAIIEATGLTGPARNLLDLMRVMRTWPAADCAPPPVTLSVVTFSREPDRISASPASISTPLLRAVRALEADISVVQERFRFDPSVVASLRAAFRQQRPDIVETHSVKSHFLARFLRVSRQTPWIAHHHGYTTTNARMRAYNLLDTWSLPSADQVVTVCSAFRQDLLNLGVPDERIVVSHSSISPDWGANPASEARSEVRSRLGLLDRERLLLSVGRLSHEKGHIELVRAFARLQSMSGQPSTRLIIVGEGPERRRLQGEAQALGVADRVVFAGQCVDVSPYYGAADVFILPSYSEGSPIAALEAMLLGVPLVVTAVGGVPEMVSQDSAVLVPPHDPGSIAEAIAELLGNPERAGRQAVQARRLALERHAPRHRAQVLMGVYQQMITGKRPHG